MIQFYFKNPVFSQKYKMTYPVSLTVVLFQAFLRILGFKGQFYSTGRSKQNNDRIPGSVSNSWHLKGLAIDLEYSYKDFKFRPFLNSLFNAQELIYKNGSHVHLEFEKTFLFRLPWYVLLIIPFLIIYLILR